MLGLLISALVYKLRTKRIFTESLLAGLFIFLIVLGLNIIVRFLKIDLLSGQIGNILLTPFFYLAATLLLTLHPRFKTEKSLTLALWIAGAILLLKILMVTVGVFAQFGLNI